MGKVSQAVGRVFQGGAKAFARYPAAMLSALVVAVSASILIQQDYPVDEKLFTNLIIAFGTGIAWGTALSALAQRLSRSKVLYILLNLFSLLASGGLFYYLYQMDAAVPVIISLRIAASAAIAFFVFLLVISHDAYRSDYGQSSFMVLKSALIAQIYTLVIMLGMFFVAFAVQQLLYKEMSETVFGHIAVWSELVGFAFFLGYFPQFYSHEDDPQLDVAQKHPAFIEVLFAYIMIPIMAALTFVVLIWAVQTLILGQWQNFNQLTVIISAYLLFGIFLWLMTSHYVQPIAEWFRKLLPIVSLVFLAFEAYAIYRQINLYGIKSDSYFVSLIWIYALLTMILMFIRPVSRIRLSGWLAIILIAVAVLPVIGYRELSVASQTGRLQTVLVKNDMLLDNQITPASPNISEADKLVITDAVTVLQQYEDIDNAVWFRDSFGSGRQFFEVFGFERVFDNGTPGVIESRYINLYLPAGYVDISEYHYGVSFSEMNDGRPVSLQSDKGVYVVTLSGISYGASNPTVLITRDGVTVLNQPISDWLNLLIARYSGSDPGISGPAIFEDMVLKLEQNGVKVMVVFRNIDVTIDSSGHQYINMFVSGLYLAD